MTSNVDMTEKSYLSSAVDSINPWATTKATAPINSATTSAPSPSSSVPIVPQESTYVDHKTNNLYGQSSKSYPADCPVLVVRWFHAVDSPKNKPRFLVNNSANQPIPKDEKSAPPPKKYVPFSTADSTSIETAYQQLLEDAEHSRFEASNKRRKVYDVNPPSSLGLSDSNPATNTVPVNEDYLFDVDVTNRELGPVYWPGPTYDVRRGTWFTMESSKLIPCEENFAAQIEEFYLQSRPWDIVTISEPPSSSTGVQSTTAAGTTSCPKGTPSAKTHTTHTPSETAASETPLSGTTSTNSKYPQSYRLTGIYQNNFVVFQDANTAWLSSDSVFSWVASTVYGKFSSGGFSGVKLTRGYSDSLSTKKAERRSTVSTSNETPKLGDSTVKVDIAPSRSESSVSNSIGAPAPSTEIQTPAEEMRKFEEAQIRSDYNSPSGEAQGREVEHLVLVTHGIGQLLSLRMDSISFIHDVNVLRKSLKSVYANSDDLRALNNELNQEKANCRVQVLPVCWRHLLDFPRKSKRKGESDLADANRLDDQYPSLQDISVEGIGFTRPLITDLALDVLLYQSGYREQIASIVVEEANKIYRQFKARNPNFKGKVHLIGHSLGSAILFDILCRQPNSINSKSTTDSWKGKFWQYPSRNPNSPHSTKQSDLFEFDVNDFYCLGSPIGMFQMLRGRTIAARPKLNSAKPSPAVPIVSVPESYETSLDYEDERTSQITGLPSSVSSPKVRQLFNIFHPSDPICYRLEPLITSAMATLKPQALPYTKKSLLNSTTQGLSSFGLRVGQSFSGLWSSVSSGIAHSILNRSLGLTSEEMARLTEQATSSSRTRNNPGATDKTLDNTLSENDRKYVADSSVLYKRTSERQKLLASPSHPTIDSETRPTLIDEDLETLYSKFNKTQTGKSISSSLDVDKGWRLRQEEEKVRQLNRNGRVDYCIQESMLDYNPISTLASHMCYWADEDVAHFVLSQILSNSTKGRS